MRMATGNNFLLRLRDRDTQNGVSRVTLARLADCMGLSETELIHKALVDCARTNLPQYEPDDGPLTARQHRRIAELTRDTRATYRETESLFARPRERREKDDKKLSPTPRPR